MDEATEIEILEIEAWLGARLPAEYRGFLLKYGSDRHGPLCGTDYLVRDLKGNNEYLPELLAENGLKNVLPARYLCFLMHQGYIAAWFDLASESPDPECWYFSEGITKVPESKGNFSSFISILMKEWGG